MGRKPSIKRPSGVKIRKWKSGRSTLMIQFNYRGEVCRETLSIEATTGNINYAARLRSQILNAIERNDFNYAEYFPDSKRARQFGHAPERVSIKEMLDKYLDEIKSRVEQSTYTRLLRVCKAHHYPNFGHIIIQDLKAFMIRDWITKQDCKLKTMTNNLIPLRAIIERALVDELIEHNPLDQIILKKLLKRDSLRSNFKVDPFNRDEINLILQNASEQVKNFYQFAFFSGLRPSELIGLRWSDIDWERDLIRVEQTVVDKQLKGPKTVSGYRDVLLLPPAKSALCAQKFHTYLAGKRVFHNPQTEAPWENSQQPRRTAWMPLLERAKVRYRNPYQTRHTYASMMLSRGERIIWVSKQMGHADSEVTLRRYARWVPDNQSTRGYELRGNWDDYVSLDSKIRKVDDHED